MLFHYESLAHVLVEPVDGGDPSSFRLGRVVARASIVVKRVVYSGVDLDLVRTAGAAQLLRNLVFCAGDPSVPLGVDGEHRGRGRRQPGQILRRWAVERHRSPDRGTRGKRTPSHATAETETSHTKPVPRAGSRQRG